MLRLTHALRACAAQHPAALCVALIVLLGLAVGLSGGGALARAWSAAALPLALLALALRGALLQARERRETARRLETLADALADAARRAESPAAWDDRPLEREALARGAWVVIAPARERDA